MRAENRHVSTLFCSAADWPVAVTESESFAAAIGSVTQKKSPRPTLHLFIHREHKRRQASLCGVQIFTCRVSEPPWDDRCTTSRCRPCDKSISNANGNCNVMTRTLDSSFSFRFKGPETRYNQVNSAHLRNSPSVAVDKAKADTHARLVRPEQLVQKRTVPA